MVITELQKPAQEQAVNRAKLAGSVERSLAVVAFGVAAYTGGSDFVSFLNHKHPAFGIITLIPTVAGAILEGRAANNFDRAKKLQTGDPTVGLWRWSRQPSHS